MNICMNFRWRTANCDINKEYGLFLLVREHGDLIWRKIYNILYDLENFPVCNTDIADHRGYYPQKHKIVGEYLIGDPYIPFKESHLVNSYFKKLP